MSIRPSSSSWLAKYATMFRDWTRRSEHPQEAEDALQDAALGMLKRQGPALADPCAYLYQSSRNNLVTGLRKLNQRAGLPLHDLDDGEHPHAADAAQDLDGVQLARAIDAALRQLPERCRQAYVWHRLDGLTQVEIAARMSVSLNTVERYIMRAMRHLRDALDDAGAAVPSLPSSSK
ncbi:RNA polymerase sigma factor [Achromobacter insuavis]|uniref:RNA polymerase sigma factor n=1 Tax=Achromobacter insuavis TaxID=1287735 RepID=UPI001F136B4C